MDIYTHNLKNRMTFANREMGEDDQTTSIEFTAPSAKDGKHYYQIKGVVSRCVMKMTDLAKGATNKEQKGEIKASEVMFMLSAGAGDELDVLVGHFMNLAPRVGKINEKTPLLREHLDGLPADEVMDMASGYVNFFILPSFISLTKDA